MKTTVPMLAVGVLLVIAAVAGFVIVPEHAPDFACPGILPPPGVAARQCGGWSQTVYDVARIGTWALLIVGGIVVAVGLIRVWRSSASLGT